MKRNRIRICGRKTSTAPVPAITPSASRLRSAPSGMCSLTRAETAETPPSMPSISGCAQLNTAWNIRNSVAASSSMPHSGCSTTASMRSSRRVSTTGSLTQSAMMRATCWCRASTCSRASPGRAGACSCGAARARASGPSSHCSSSRAPSWRTPTVDSTGMPRARDSASRSISMPWRLAMSLMLSTSSMGRPRRWASSTRRRFRRRWVASVTQTSSSGGASRAWRPETMSRVMRSSSLWACRL